ncbi:hypothetical protein LUZ61_016337 [Rhynchospora tenuis]|uniref:Serine/threonine-protein kinase BSK1-like TPR repeats domain-containing protein n=1 Tax=Rhynchospora tenuis TaxID=198213 RepID=A0AAD5Z5C0_9POAL|nr:hypothetical protein LUZ61_016337 [Rhynchospora tenuis]
MAASDQRKATKLLKAISSGNLVLVKELAKQFNEARIKRIEDEDGDSALHVAAFFGRTKICQYLVEDLGFHVDFLSPNGETPFFYAVMKCHVATAKYLISRGANPAVLNNKGINPLHHAARHGHIKLVKYLLSLGVPVDGTLKNAPFTPLMVAAQCDQASTVKVLLQNRADVNHATITDDTPLFSSVRAGSLECTKLLIKAGADLNLKCPLAMAVHMQSIEIIKCLLKAGADPNVCNIYGQLPIETAVMGKNRNIVEMLFPLTSPIREVDDWSVQGIIQYVNSDAFYQKNIEAMENSTANLKGKGDDSFRKKEYMIASIFYSKAIGLGEMIGFGDAVLYSNRSLCWHRLREGDQALDDALMAHRLSPEWPKAYYRIGSALMLLEDYKQASEAFLDGLQLDPTNTEMRKAHREALACMMISCFGEEE